MTTEPQPKPYQEEIIALMLQQESLLATLYRTFGRKFPEYEQLWDKLAREEEKHSGWLEQLLGASKKKVVLFREGKIRTSYLETFVKGIEEKLKQAEADGFNSHGALLCTIDLERNLLEHNVFSHFSGLTEKARSIMNFLAKETREHQELAEKLYAKTKGRRPRN